MAKIRRNLDQEKAIETVNDRLRELACFKKVLTDPENNDYSFLIGGADKHRTELSFDLASKIIGELTKADKKVINDIRKKYDIELEPAEEALLN